MDTDKMELLIGKVLPSVCMVLLLSSVSNCEPNCTDIRLFNVEHRNGEGRVEILCNDQWGTICSDDINTDFVVCRYQGFGQNWRPNRTTEFGEGTGSVWDVRCNGKKMKIQDCIINPTNPIGWFLHEKVNHTFFNHTNDIGVKCQGQYIGNLSQNEKIHEDDKRKIGSNDSKKQDITQSTEEQNQVHGNGSAMIVVDVVGFTVILAAIALCGFLINRRFAVNSYVSKEKEQSQTLLSPSPHVTIQAEPISHDQTEGGLELTEERDNHGPALTEVNPVYEPAIEMAETSLAGKGQECEELTDSSYPVLTEVNPCYGAAVEITGTSVRAQRDGQQTNDLGDIPTLTEENPCYEKY